MTDVLLVASCPFGLEAVVARELQHLHFSTRIVGPGQVDFRATMQADDPTASLGSQWDKDSPAETQLGIDWRRAVCLTNLWLRAADRVSIVVREFSAPDFDTLFDTIQSIAWETFIPQNAKILVTGKSLKSILTSVPAIQRTVKKGIVERFLAHGSSLPEDGPTYKINVALRDDVARITLDTTGPSLHKRGYREIATKAPLKETMAAALIQLSFWRPDRPMIDPFCGGGTIPIEAALIGRNIPPGLRRTFDCEAWPNFSKDLWRDIRAEAESQIAPPLEQRIIGTDIHPGAISLAMKNAIAAGVESDVHFQQKRFEELSSKRKYGCVITNPPYGSRLGPDELPDRDLRQLYESIPLILRRLPTWSHFILTPYPDFERLLGKEADRRRKLYNGRIECTYYQFHGPPPPRTTEMVVEPLDSEQESEPTPAPTVTAPLTSTHAHARSLPRTPIVPVFGGLPPKGKEQAELLASRLRKRARHLRRWPSRRGITCYRIYEKDIPEIPLVVDRYEDHLHIVEYDRPHEHDMAQHADWLQLMADTCGEVLEIPREQVFIKARHRQRGTQQHEKISDQGYTIVVHEAGLRFLVNLSDYADTGLFLDHRSARGMIRDLAEGGRVLNLFCYTGAFSVYAAAGGASETTSVDWSRAYVEWAQQNFRLNEFQGAEHRFIRDDVRAFVENLSPHAQYDLIVVDPPTFSNSKRTEATWDIQRDHGDLLRRLLRHLAPSGSLFFSSNFRRLKLDPDLAAIASLKEISKQTLPEDFRNQRIHRSWLYRHHEG